MADSDSASSPPVATPLSSSGKENVMITTKIADLNEARSELITKVQGLKQELQKWRSKLDTQVKIYREELCSLKSTLSSEVEQLKLDFQELSTTLQKQQDDVQSSLKQLGMKDNHANAKETEAFTAESTAEDGQNSLLPDDKKSEI